MKLKWKVSLTIIAACVAGLLYVLWDGRDGVSYRTPIDGSATAATGVSGKNVEEPKQTLPSAKTIPGLSHVWQTFNNCSSVALVVALSRWDVYDTQEAIADATRPWRNQRGDNDDKAVDLFELAAYAEAEHGFTTFVRPNGRLELLKEFIANDIPVVTRTLMYADKDFQHYRVVRGYDDTKKIIIESNGIDGSNHTSTYDEWMHYWKDFNYSYLIVVPENKKALVERILGEEASENVAWANARARASAEVAKDPNDMRAAYNTVTALYYSGDYEGTVREFEKIESRLSEHKLWYQMEPIDAYFKLGTYDRVIALADSVINNNNKSVSELYVLKGKVYESRGQIAEARAEYEKAIYYNKSLQSAKDALARLGG